MSTSDVTIMYSSSADGEYVAEKPTFTDAGTYTVYYSIKKDNCDPVSGSATVTITQCTPQLYFTQASVVLQNDQDKCQLEWVYTGDGILRFGSSDDHAVWVDDNGVVYRKRSNCGTSIYCKASETKNCKSVTAMCNVEHGISYIYYDPMNHKPIIEKLDITTKETLEEKVEVLTSELLDLEKPPVLYIDAKLIDPSDPYKKKELHNVRVNFTVPYEDIKEASPAQFEEPLSACDFTVLHQRIDNTIEEVSFLRLANGLLICDTTLSPFAIVAYPKQYYNLYYDVNGGTGTPMIQRVPMDSESYSVTMSSEKPSRSGYKFVGWSTSRNSTDVTYYMPGDTITLDRDIILYAVWSEETYTVTLNTNGGTINSGDITGYTYGQGAALPTDVTKAGCTFAGWYDNENLTGDPVTAISDTDTENKVLWAKWDENTYTVTLNTNGGTINSGNVTEYTYGQGAALPTDVTKAGCTFAGWYDNENLTGDPVTAISETDALDKAYWAKWDVNTYAVIFNTDGGDTIADKMVHWSDMVLDGIAAPTKNGWGFTGWKCGDASVTENTTYGDLAENDTTTSITLVAQWKSISTSTGGGIRRPARPNTPSEPKPSIGGFEKSWSDIAADLAKLTNGPETTIELNGNTTVPAALIKVIDDRQLKVTFVVDSIRNWKTDGAKIIAPAEADLSIIAIRRLITDSLRGISGFQFMVNGTNIPTDLMIAFKEEHSGKYANLYKVVDGKPVFVTCAKLGEDGKVILPDVTEKGDYAAMLCEFSDKPGDINNDGVLNDMDANAILKDIVGLEQGKNPLVSDINGDGRMNALDASAILKRFLGLA